MALLDEILTALNKWDAWRRIIEAPAKIDALETRVAALEAAIKGKPGQDCPACGKPALRVTGTRPIPGFEFAGRNVYQLKCEACGFTDQRTQL